MRTYMFVLDPTMHFTSLEDPVEGKTTVLNGRDSTNTNFTIAQRRSGMKGLQFGIVEGLNISGVPLRRKRSGICGLAIHFSARFSFSLEKMEKIYKRL